MESNDAGVLVGAGKLSGQTCSFCLTLHRSTNRFASRSAAPSEHKNMLRIHSGTRNVCLCDSRNPRFPSTPRADLNSPLSSTRLTTVKLRLIIEWIVGG